MSFIKQQNKKRSSIEALPVLRIMGSANKFSEEALRLLKAKAGSAGVQGDRIGYAIDSDTNSIAIFKAKDEEAGSIIGGNKSITNTALRTALIQQAMGKHITDKDENRTGEIFTKSTKIEEGFYIRFDISTTPIKEGGTEFYPLTFAGAVKVDSSEEEESENEIEEVKPKASPAKAVEKTTSLSLDDF